jgi:hemoglobin
MTAAETLTKDQLRILFVDFYNRVFDDTMIGFLFHGKDKQRLIDKEVEFTQRILGEDVPYTGRGMRQAHAKVPVLGGHFDRRMQILRDVLTDHNVSESIQTPWLKHTASLRSIITDDPSSACNHDLAAAKVGKKQSES